MITSVPGAGFTANKIYYTGIWGANAGVIRAFSGLLLTEVLNMTAVMNGNGDYASDLMRKLMLFPVPYSLLESK